MLISRCVWLKSKYFVHSLKAKLKLSLDDYTILSLKPSRKYFRCCNTNIIYRVGDCCRSTWRPDIKSLMMTLYTYVYTGINKDCHFMLCNKLWWPVECKYKMKIPFLILEFFSIALLFDFYFVSDTNALKVRFKGKYEVRVKYCYNYWPNISYDGSLINKQNERLKMLVPTA